MNTETAKILCKINKDFYRSQSSSFSETRQAPWTGWHRCAEVIEKTFGLKQGDIQKNAAKAQANVQEKSKANVCSGIQEDQHLMRSDLSVLDLACGNLRFEQYLSARFPGIKPVFYAVDDCDDLVPEMRRVTYQSLDIMDAILAQDEACKHPEGHLQAQLDAPCCDISVSFGFMHHIPSQKNRHKVLQALVDKTRKGGLVMVSFWQFLNNKTLADKAAETHKKALSDLSLSGLDVGDYLLGWKNKPGVYRYCHSFSQAEIDELVQSLSNTQLIESFAADGRTENLNSYLILQVW